MNTAVNNITGALMKTKPSTEEYSKGWEKIFGKKREHTGLKFKTVAFISKYAMENHLKPSKDTAIISITDPSDTPANIPEGFHSILRVQFDDLYEELLREEVGTFPDICLQGDILWHNLVLPDARHAKAILEFINQLDCDHLVVHCHAGISRSAAVAQFVANVYHSEIDQANGDTSLANKRLLRLLNKVYLNEELDIS